MAENARNGHNGKIDPTVLTTEQLLREVSNLKEALEDRITLATEIIATRLGGMDKAISLLQGSNDKAPEFVRDQVGQLRALHDEKFGSVKTELSERDRRVEQKFGSIDTQFEERDKRQEMLTEAEKTRTEQLSVADKTAIAAALQAQKEAAGATNEANGAALTKMENNFTKLIDGVSVQVSSVSRNLEDKINETKSRMDRGEGKTSVSDPVIADGMRELKSLVTKLGEVSSMRSGGEKAVADNTARTLSIAAVAVAALVGLGEVLAHLVH